MTPEWDHVNGTINLLMNGYIEYILNKFQHEALKQPQHDPHPYVTPQYGARTKMTQDNDDSILLVP